MSGNDFLGAFYEKPQKPCGFSWLEGVQTGQRLENPAAPATNSSPGVAHFIRFIAPRVLISPPITLKRAFRNPSEPLSASTVWGINPNPPFSWPNQTL